MFSAPALDGKIFYHVHISSVGSHPDTREHQRRLSDQHGLNKEDRKASGTYMYKQTQKQNKIMYLIFNILTSLKYIFLLILEIIRTIFSEVSLPLIKWAKYI